MLTRRIIPCLDIRAGRVVKGVAFANLRDVGDPLERAAAYMADGADELCFLDVTASIEDRPLLLDLVRRLSRVLFIPFSVGGGVQSVEDARALLRSGADKISVNTAAAADPDLIRRLSEAFGNQCVVLSVDALAADGRWVVTTHGGRRRSDTPVLEWVRRAVDLGAGEILLNCIDTDGVREGFELELTRTVAQAVPVPVIASGGAGCGDDFVELFTRTGAQAGLAASIFHEGGLTPAAVKRVLAAAGVEVRP